MPFEALLQGFDRSASDHFTEVAAGGDAVAFHIGFMALTILIVVGGVKGGIERASLLLMRCCPDRGGARGLGCHAAGAGAGYAVYLKPQLREIMDPAVWRAAVAQAFFSLSLGMGGMLTFASYLHRDQKPPRVGHRGRLHGLRRGVVAGLVVFPVIFSLGLQGAVGASTVGALFIRAAGRVRGHGCHGARGGRVSFSSRWRSAR